MKLVSVGVDPDYIGIIADHVSAELYDLQSLIACKWLISLKNIICVWSLIDRRFFECVNQSSAISGAQSFSVRSRFSNESHAARLRGSLTISKCALLLLLFKMNATRDWNRKGSSCGSWLTFAWGAGAALFKLWPKAQWLYFKLVSNNCHYFTSV